MANGAANSKRVGVNSAEPGVFKLRHLLYLTLAGLFTLAIFSHQRQDYAVISGGVDAPMSNWIGNLGAYSSCTLFYLIGLSSYIVALIFFFAALRPLIPLKLNRHWFWPGFFCSVAGATLLLALDPAGFAGFCERLGLGSREVPDLALSGGLLGQVLVAPEYQDLAPGFLRLLIGTVGSAIVGSILLAGGVVMLYCSEWHSVAMSIWEVLGTPDEVASGGAAQRAAVAAPELESEPEPPPESAPAAENTPKAGLLARAKNLLNRPAAAASAPPAVTEVVEAPPPVLAPSPVVEPSPEPVARSTSEPPVVAAGSAGTAPNSGGALAPARIVEAGTRAPKVRCSDYVLPPLTMLGKGAEISGESPEAIARNREILQNTLDSFKINGTVTGHISGPRVTRYEISLAPSVKVNTVTGIESNIAMNLAAKSLRILAPIPGRNVVGIEVPNSRAEAIMLRSVAETDAWLDNKYEIPIMLGKDIAGKPVVMDLAKAPHLLIAGTTGSGKSVCMNTLIMSLLMRFSPDDLRLIMVDPKVVEMATYQALPHLITPVIDNAKKVPNALRWAANEMDKRYKLLARARVRKLKDYNHRPIPAERQCDEDGIPLPDKLPVLVIIIDELADLMATEAKGEIENSIARIAAKGRAAGVHVVVATQRPSRDVITGTIKSNLPTRIAFRVISLIDSRVILDQKGAEALLGQGDMLLLSPNSSAELERIQGAYVADSDIEKVVDFVSAQAPQEFDGQVVADAPVEGGAESDGDGDWSEEDADRFIDGEFEFNPIVQKYLQPGDDELVRKVLEVIVIDKKVSTSFIQRRLKIGYNRAAELIDLMEERGIVGPPSGSGAKREILIFDDVVSD